MVKVIILEDEPSAYRRVKRMIAEIRPNWDIVGHADSVSGGYELVRNTEFDLIFSDIQLSDGTCFELFSKAGVDIPVIFITAYDRHAIKAFEFNSVHYLMKPIKVEQLHEAIQKFENQRLMNYNDQESLFDHSGILSDKILSKLGNKTTVIETEDIAYAYYEDRATFAVDGSGKRHFLDPSLDKLQEYLSSDQFYRINRQQIVSRSSIKSFVSYTSDRLLLELNIDTSIKFIVSKDKTPDFRRWLTT